MKTLSEILALKEKILNLTDAFGFQKENIKLYKDNEADNSNSLYLLVQQIPNVSISYKNKTLLQAILIDELKCNVIVRDYDGINALDKYDYDINSRDFSDVDGLCQLYNRTSTNEIAFVDYGGSGDYLDLQPKVLKHAREFLQQKNKTTATNFNKSSSSNNNTLWKEGINSQPLIAKEEKPMIEEGESGEKKESLDIKVLAYLKANANLWHSLEQSPQEWERIQQVVEQELKEAYYNKSSVVAK